MKKVVVGLLGLALSFAGAAHAEHPEIEVDGKGQRYVVWLKPQAADGSIRPLTAENVTYYCSVAEGFAQRIYKLTNKRHNVFQVEYVYGDAPMRRDAEWTRDDAVATGGGVIQLADAVLQAVHTWSEGSDPDGVTNTASTRKECKGGVCITATCPSGFTIVPNSFSPNRERCKDSAGTVPLESIADAAFTFAHEAGHSKYSLQDEYFGDESNTILYGVRVCSNGPEWHTSLMSTRDADLWCDVNTHLFQRFVSAPFSGSHVISTAVGNQWTRAITQFQSKLSDYDPGPPFVQGPGVVPQNESFTRPAPPWQPLASDPICKFTGSLVANQVLNDVMVVVDKSGSMNYRATPLDLTAFEHAFSAGLAHFNRTGPGRKSGLSVFDSTVARPIPYGAFTSAHQLSEFPLTASGQTNLCDAINDAATQVRNGGTNDSSGHMLLLTDGRPTTSNCNTAEAVRAAANAACKPTGGAKQVVISVLAFGDADFSLLDQVAQICGGDLRVVDAAGGTGSPVSPASIPAGSPRPVSIQAAASRLAYRIRGYNEAVFAEELKPAVFERSFDLPPGTAEAEFAWMGEHAEHNEIPDPPTVTVTSLPAQVQTAAAISPAALAASGDSCDFANYGFEVVDPSGNIVGADVVSPATELAYLTRTKRVSNPAPGRWTMRARGGAPCVVGGSAPAPDVAMFAIYRNQEVRAEVELSSVNAAQNDRVVATAKLRIAPNTYMAGITVAAKLVNGTTQISLPMYDDGTNGGDAIANDGVYTTAINPSCISGTLNAGGYRFVVEMSSNKNTAVAVLSRDLDVRTTVGLNAIPSVAPVTASLVEEKFLSVSSCNSPAPACGGSTTSNVCARQQISVNGPVQITPGTTVPNVTVNVKNCPIASTGVQVGIGPGVTASNVRSTYNDATATGTVTFDMTAAATARPGNDQIAITWGRTTCDTTGAVIPVCRAVPTTLTPATISVCGASTTQNVTLTRPSFDGACIAPSSVSGRVITSNGVTLNPPRTVPSDGVLSLALGTHVVEWTFTSNGVTRTARQTVFVASAVTAAGSFLIADRARVMRDATTFNAIVNTGNGLTDIGARSETGDVTSVGNVTLRDRSIVHGFIKTSGALVRQNLTTVTGSITEHAPLTLGGVQNPPITFPPTLPASDVIIPLNGVGTAVPGPHGRITVNPGGRLTLAGADYLIENLDIEPGAAVVVAPTTRLFVKNTAIYRGAFVNAANQPTSTFLAYYGTNALFMESNFSGTLLAASARAVLGDSDSHSYGGRVLAKEIELRPDTTLTCSSSVNPIFDATDAPPSTLRTLAGPAAAHSTDLLAANDAELSDSGQGGCSIRPISSSKPWLAAVTALAALALAARRRRRV